MKTVTGVILVLLLILFALPLALLLLSSVAEGGAGDLVRGKLCFSLSQYRELFANGRILRRFLNSAIITGGSLALQGPVSALGGFFLARSKSRLARGLTVCMVIALLLPFQSVMVPVFRLSKWLNLHDSLWAVMLLQGFSPLGPLTVRLLLRTVPESNWEAALLDTSSQLRIYVRVILPQILPGLSILFLLGFSEAWNLVEQPLTLLQSEELLPASMSLNDIELREVGPYAGAVVYSAPIVVLYALTALLMKRHQPENLLWATE